MRWLLGVFAISALVYAISGLILDVATPFEFRALDTPSWEDVALRINAAAFRIGVVTFGFLVLLNPTRR